MEWCGKHCRWLNKDCLKRKVPNNTLQAKLKKAKGGEEQAQAVWESFWPAMPE